MCLIFFFICLFIFNLKIQNRIIILLAKRHNDPVTSLFGLQNRCGMFCCFVFPSSFCLLPSCCSPRRTPTHTHTHIDTFIGSTNLLISLQILAWTFIYLFTITPLLNCYGVEWGGSDRCARSSLDAEGVGCAHVRVDTAQYVAVVAKVSDAVQPVQCVGSYRPAELDVTEA